MTHIATIECDYWWTEKGERRNQRLQFSCEREIDGMDFVEAKKWARGEHWLLDMVTEGSPLKRDFCPDHAALCREMGKDGLQRQPAPTKLTRQAELL